MKVFESKQVLVIDAWYLIKLLPTKSRNSKEMKGSKRIWVQFERITWNLND